jgi:threonine aldolase
LSKGLGVPIGSVIIGDAEFIERARVFRKMFGGGMRQVGVIVDINIDKTQDEVLELLKTNGVLLTPERQNSIRAVMHLDVTFEEVEQMVNIFQRLFE